MKRIAFSLCLLATLAVSGCTSAKSTETPSPVPLPPTKAPTPTPSLPPVDVIVGLGYLEDDTFHVLGEVVNNTDKWYDYVEVEATFSDDQGKLLGSDSRFIALDYLAPGDKAPFDLSSSLDGAAASVATYELQVRPPEEASDVPYQDLEIVGEREDKSSYYPQIFGEVRNTGASACKYTEIIAAAYDAKGRVIDVGGTYADGDIFLAQKSSPFDLYLGGPDAPYDDYRLWTQCEPVETQIPATLIATPGGEGPVTIGDLVFQISKVRVEDAISAIEGPVTIFYGDLEMTENGWVPEFTSYSEAFLTVVVALQSGDYKSLVDVDPLLMQGDSVEQVDSILTQAEQSRVIWVYALDSADKSCLLVFPDGTAIDLTPLIP